MSRRKARCTAHTTSIQVPRHSNLGDTLHSTCGSNRRKERTNLSTVGPTGDQPVKAGRTNFLGARGSSLDYAAISSRAKPHLVKALGTCRRQPHACFCSICNYTVLRAQTSFASFSSTPPLEPNWPGWLPKLQSYRLVSIQTTPGTGLCGIRQSQESGIFGQDDSTRGLGNGQDTMYTASVVRPQTLGFKPCQPARANTAQTAMLVADPFPDQVSHVSSVFGENNPILSCPWRRSCPAHVAPRSRTCHLLWLR